MRLIQEIWPRRWYSCDLDCTFPSDKPSLENITRTELGAPAAFWLCVMGTTDTKTQILIGHIKLGHQAIVCTNGIATSQHMI